MHYFKLNIGDYHKKAGRLTMLEHGAYTLLLHACYDREKFPTKSEAIDWCWARSPDEVAAVEFVLAKFFTLEDDRYVQHRIKEEIDTFHAKSEKNKHIALEREAARRTKRARNVDDSSPDKHASPPNHKPITTNQEPKSSVPIGTGDVPPPDGPPEDPPLTDRDKIFAYGVPILVGAGNTDKAARSFLGGKAKEYGDAEVVQALRECYQQHPIDPMSWLGKRLPIKGKRSAHSGFEKVNYREGIEEDGSFV